MGLISPASGRETEMIVACGNSSKILVGSGASWWNEKNDDIEAEGGSDCIWTYRGPPPAINCSDPIPNLSNATAAWFDRIRPQLKSLNPQKTENREMERSKFLLVEGLFFLLFLNYKQQETRQCVNWISWVSNVGFGSIHNGEEDRGNFVSFGRCKRLVLYFNAPYLKNHR